MNNRIKSYIAAIDLEEHTPVKFVSDGKVTKAENETDNVIGVTDFSVKAGKIVDVILLGISHIQIEDTCNYGDLLVAAGGKAKVFNSESAEGTITIIGKALEATQESAYINAIINPVPLLVQKTA